ncbi:MAG: flagellar motor switch protein FliN [Proteobacteria bacterium]|nr:flagellar motor switch protein FliN [Pseudomonadota bacterium]
MKQDEMDNLMKDLEKAEDSADKSDDEISWDDVQDELEKSQEAVPEDKPVPKTDVSNVDFGEIQKTEKPDATLDLDFILDIPLTLSVELGRSRMLISELLQLGQGSVLELTKLAGEPMDVFINQRLIARGEVVVVNEKFGIRLTDIISPAERVTKLK